jgi:uncharacterized protein
MQLDKKRLMMSPRSVFAIALLYTSIAISADVPALRGRVNDYAGLLQPQVREQLEASLAHYEHETTHQIAILSVTSLHGESIETFSLRVAKNWALGRKGLDNGVLVTVAPTERSVRIELGTGMNRYVSDSDAKRIIDEVMVPEFRQGHYDVGLLRGIDRLFDACRRYKVPPSMTR